ncbi:MAG: hypothetical protein HY735_25690 [Verrucomicrobia bacterium]|nr:hypothetical protein [Verrucomicrobiota bacterium]
MKTFSVRFGAGSAKARQRLECVRFIAAFAGAQTRIVRVWTAERVGKAPINRTHSKRFATPGALRASTTLNTYAPSRSGTGGDEGW